MGTTKLCERVVMLRSTPTHSDKVQQILTQLFTEDNVTDIKTLREYIFVPMMIVGDKDRSILQGVLRTQQLFRMNVYHYIVANVWNINIQFQVPVLQEFATTAADTDVEMTDQTEQKHETSAETNNDDATEKGTSKDKSPFEADPVATEPYSLREWFYDFTDTIYPTADDNKLLVLCEKQKSIKVLQILHNLVDIVGTDFPETQHLRHTLVKTNKIRLC